MPAPARGRCYPDHGRTSCGVAVNRLTGDALVSSTAGMPWSANGVVVLRCSSLYSSAPVDRDFVARALIDDGALLLRNDLTITFTPITGDNSAFFVSDGTTQLMVARGYCDQGRIAITGTFTVMYHDQGTRSEYLLGSGVITDAMRKHGRTQ